MTQDNYFKLEKTIVERMQMQLDNPLNELGVPYTTQELLAFAIEEAYQNDELDFLCEVAYYQCKDEACKTKYGKPSVQTRDAETLQEAGDPYCNVCEGDMEAITAEHYQKLTN